MTEDTYGSPDPEFCDNCERELERGACPVCVNCEFCDELTTNDPDEDERILCSRCAEPCGICGYADCQCDAMYDAWRDRQFDID